MARKRASELREAQRKLAPVVRNKWTAEDQAASDAARAKYQPEVARLLKEPKRTGRAYWQWLLDEVAAGRKKVPQSTIDTARQMVGEGSRLREPGQDDEELQMAFCDLRIGCAYMPGGPAFNVWSMPSSASRTIRWRRSRSPAW